MNVFCASHSAHNGSRLRALAACYQLLDDRQLRMKCPNG